MVVPISLIAATESSVAVCMPAIWALISSVALAVCVASVFTSAATTAKPRPASPARAASMVALSASRLVCSAIAVISLTTSPMRLAASDNSPMRASVASACRTASPAILRDSSTCRLISRTDALSCSLARRHRLDVAGRLLGGFGHQRGQLLRGVRRVGQALGGGFELGRRPTTSSRRCCRPSRRRYRRAAAFPPCARRAPHAPCCPSSSASPRAFSTALSLKASIARAISPTSSRRPRPGRTTSKLPAASSFMAAAMARSWRDTPRPIRKRRPQLRSMMNRMAIRICAAVSAREAASAAFALATDALGFRPGWRRCPARLPHRRAAAALLRLRNRSRARPSRR